MAIGGGALGATRGSIDLALEECRRWRMLSQRVGRSARTPKQSRMDLGRGRCGRCKHRVFKEIDRAALGLIIEQNPTRPAAALHATMPSVPRSIAVERPKHGFHCSKRAHDRGRVGNWQREHDATMCG